MYNVYICKISKGVVEVDFENLKQQVDIMKLMKVSEHKCKCVTLNPIPFALPNSKGVTQ